VTDEFQRVLARWLERDVLPHMIARRLLADAEEADQ
jgi:hypothetical protein